jgi:hypothetical protein
VALEVGRSDRQMRHVTLSKQVSSLQARCSRRTYVAIGVSGMVLLLLLEALAAERCCEDEAEACSRMLDTPCEGFRGLFVVGVGRRLEDSRSLGRALRVLAGSLRWPSRWLLLALFQYGKK